MCLFESIKKDNPFIPLLLTAFPSVAVAIHKSTKSAKLWFKLSHCTVLYSVHKDRRTELTGNSPISPYPKDTETVKPLCEQNMGARQESRGSVTLLNLPFYLKKFSKVKGKS